MSETAIPSVEKVSSGAFTMVELQDAVEAEGSLSGEEDFVVYDDDTGTIQPNETLLEIESRAGVTSTSEDRELPENNQDKKLEDDEKEVLTAMTNGQKKEEVENKGPPRMNRYSEEAITCFSDVPLLQGNPDGILFNGLVFCDTIDSMCRPVVVINTRAIPHKSLRTAALRHLREALEPVVASGPYVLIFTSFASSTLSKLPVSWVVAAYRELSYPFRKNVQYVILVRPNKLLKALVRVMKMVVSKKAHSKVKQILYLGDIESVTNGEVTLEHLSPKVIQALGGEELHYSDISITT